MADLGCEPPKKIYFPKFVTGITPKKYLKDGTFIKATTIEELATKCGINKENLLKTVERFNSFTYQGLDDDFGRGNDVYDRYYADYRVLPNANLAPIENAPFYAIKYYPGDLGTKGGLLTDENGKVLNEDGSVIEGCIVRETARPPSWEEPTLGRVQPLGLPARSHILA